MKIVLSINSTLREVTGGGANGDKQENFLMRQ